MKRGDEEKARLADIVKTAADLAALVPEPLREAAFNRVFEELATGGAAEARLPPSSERRGRSSEPRAARRSESPRLTDEDPVAVVMDTISRTDHPEVSRATRALDRGLWVLRIAEAHGGVDGLTAPQVAKVLTEKFRLRVSRQAINQAFDAAGDYVDRTPTPRGVLYRLMEPGERYLDAGGAEALSVPSAARSPRSGTPNRRREEPAKKAPAKKQSRGAGTASRSTSRKRSSRGPKALIEELIAEGFFSEPRTLAAIQERLRHKKGAVFKPTDLSPSLVRLLRQGKLDRDRNDSNQYEYHHSA